MATFLMPPGRQRGWTNNGAPAAGCLLYTYEAGTSTPKAAFTDAAGLVPHTNPIVLDAKGEALIYWDGNYRIDLRTAAGVQITGYPVDNFETPLMAASLSASTGGGLVGFLYAAVYGVGTMGRWLQDMALSAGSTFVGWAQSGVGPLTRSISDKLREGYVSPEDFGDPGTGLDYSDYLQKALDTGKNVWLTPGKVYGITREMSSTTAGITITGGGTIKFLAGFTYTSNTLSALAVTGANTTIDAVTFDGGGVANGTLNNRFVWCTAARLKVTPKASFISLPRGGTNFNGAIGCSGAAPYAAVVGAYFFDNPGSIFFQGRTCIAQGNRIINPNDVAIALNGTNCYGCVVVGNTIDNEAGNACSSLIAAEEGASNWVIEGNRLKGIKDGTGIAALSVVVFTQVRGGKIIGNIIDGNNLVTTNPCALISCNQYYDDVDISNNEMFNVPSGNANTRLIICSATGGRVANNNIDGVSVVGLSAMMQIGPGTRGLTVKDNTSRAAAGGRHVLFLAGTYTGNPVVFEGGKFYGGAEGINTELNIGTITGLTLRIENISDNTSTSILSCLTLLGSRSTWMNSGAWARPHRIGVFTEMHITGSSGVPAAGTFQNGDKLYFMAPVSGGYAGIIRESGTWKSFGLIT